MQKPLVPIVGHEVMPASSAAPVITNPPHIHTRHSDPVCFYCHSVSWPQSTSQPWARGSWPSHLPTDDITATTAVNKLYQIWWDTWEIVKESKMIVKRKIFPMLKIGNIKMQGIRPLYSATVDGLQMEAINERDEWYTWDWHNYNNCQLLTPIGLVIHILSFMAMVVFYAQCKK